MKKPTRRGEDAFMAKRRRSRGADYLMTHGAPQRLFAQIFCFSGHQPSRATRKSGENAAIIPRFTYDQP
jgi:hypothetical protein